MKNTKTLEEIDQTYRLDLSQLILLPRSKEVFIKDIEGYYKALDIKYVFEKYKTVDIILEEDLDVFSQELIDAIFKPVFCSGYTVGWVLWKSRILANKEGLTKFIESLYLTFELK